jgi:hypothetical protein
MGAPLTINTTIDTMQLLAIVLLPLFGSLFAGLFGSKFHNSPIQYKKMIHSEN